MNQHYDIVFIGLSLSSSWGNGHATTFRALLRGLDGLGHRVLFLERNMPWYARNRDLAKPDFCTLLYYDCVEELLSSYAHLIKSAKAVVIGSYVPDGISVIDNVRKLEPALLCFYDIDTPVTLANLSAGKEEYLARRQIPHFDIYFSFSGGPVLEVLEDRFGAPRAEALYCSVDVDRYYRTDEPAVWDLGYLGTYSPDRQAALERLLIEPARRLPNMKFVVAGPQYPDDIHWPRNVERIDHLGPSEHSSFYSRQRFTLNVTRADMRATGWSPSVRLFEAAACQTPVISDRWEGLGDLFPRAVMMCDDTADVVSVLEDFADEERLGIAAAAHSIVMMYHTGLARARELSLALAIDRLSNARQNSEIMSA